jgi:NAD(P)-dependent dehydrogenase (short-subunit alcohol dehydrogenase family)
MPSGQAVRRAALPHRIRAAEDSARRVADLVNIGFTAGRVAPAFQGVYAMTKSGLIAFSESLGQEMQPPRVRVGVIEPGIVQTDMDGHSRREAREAMSRQAAGIEQLLPKDVADTITHRHT